MTNGNDFSERLRRVERVVAGEEDVSQKQAIILVLDLVAATYDQTRQLGKVVTKNEERSENNKSRIDVTEVRVNLGIGLTVLVSIVAAILILTGIA